ncbi:MAG: hypothetical protein AB7D51_03225 [Desulfovibrionaceae bacterium]
MRDLTKDQYNEKIRCNKKALEYALDIRKFEIDLYWKRASYFWTLIGASLAGFIALKASSIDDKSKQDILVIISCIGLSFSYAWFLVNKGSKFWQVNWEKHVDMLEDEHIGSLYKISFYGDRPEHTPARIKNYITGPAQISVSKINQIISLFVTLVWINLLSNLLLPLSFEKSIDWFHVSMISTTIAAIGLFHWLGRSNNNDSSHTARLRESKFSNDTSQEN